MHYQQSSLLDVLTISKALFRLLQILSALDSEAGVLTASTQFVCVHRFSWTFRKNMSLSFIALSDIDHKNKYKNT
jgi:hypothetical protein